MPFGSILTRSSVGSAFDRGDDDGNSSFGSFADLEELRDIQALEPYQPPVVGDCDNEKVAVTGGLDQAFADLAMVIPHGVHRGAPLPPNEAERINKLHELGILDSMKEESFDDITRMLAKLFNVPIALVSIIDSTRQWFKSAVGVDLDETPREFSFCAHLLLPLEPEVLVVPDTALDPRFCNNPLVTGEPFVRFYCGAPIIVKGVRLGSLCIIDSVPRADMDQSLVFLLANFADMVAGLIEKRQPCVPFGMIDQPSFLVEVSAEGWPIVYSNEIGKACLGDVGSQVPHLFDIVKMDEFDIDPLRKEPRVQAGIYRGEVDCICYFHPASTQVHRNDMKSTITCPWDLPLDTNAGKRYDLVILKFANVAPAPTLSPAPAMMWIRSVEELDCASQRGPCVVLYTSRFCAACTHFADFYSMAAKMYAKQGVQFYAVSVDETMDVVRACCGGAMFLPMVHFCNEQSVTPVATGSWAHFRQELGAFIKRSAATISTTAAEGVHPDASANVKMLQCDGEKCFFRLQAGT
jgi:hypothetical protein